MSNETKFLKLCNAMAHLEDGIKVLEKVGLNPEPDEGIGYDLYHSCSIVYNVASEYLEFPSVNEENEVCNILMQANRNTVDKVAKEVWDKYGIK
jgi:hypothetical protein